MSQNIKHLKFKQIKEVLALVAININAVKQNKYAENYAQMPTFEHKVGQRLLQD